MTLFNPQHTGEGQAIPTESVAKFYPTALPRATPPLARDTAHNVAARSALLSALKRHTPRYANQLPLFFKNRFHLAPEHHPVP